MLACDASATGHKTAGCRQTKATDMTLTADIRDDLILVDEVEETCPATGVRHTTVTARRRHPAVYGVYVGHPVSGIRVGRIAAMQAEVRAAFDRANAGAAQRVATFFPMRTTHLRHDEVGASEYAGAEGLFTDTRHFTLQNRLDALCNADGVLLNFGLRDDEGRWRLSNGIPFDWGWAAHAGKPVVAVISRDNPNWSPGLARAACLATEDLEEGVRALNGLLPHAAARSASWAAAVEVFDFAGCPASPDMIARLARADARKHTEGGRAIVVVMPEGDRNRNWHGQVRQVADWVLPSREDAARVVRHLVGA